MSQRESSDSKKQNKPTHEVFLSLPSLPSRGDGRLAGIFLFSLFEEQRTEKFFFQNPISDHPACARPQPLFTM